MNTHTILLVEDDRDTREMYQDVLEEAGFRVEVAIDGMEGLNKAVKDHFDLIILDIMMPKLDGVAFLKKLREQPMTVFPPIITVTNLENDDVLRETLTLGASECFIKSDIDPDQLVNKVQQIVH